MRSNFADDDQTTLNRFIERTDATRLSDRFFNYGRTSPGRWTGGPIKTPPDMLAHHANHVVGVPAKIRMMEQVRTGWKSAVSCRARIERGPKGVRMRTHPGRSPYDR